MSVDKFLIYIPRTALRTQIVARLASKGCPFTVSTAEEATLLSRYIPFAFCVTSLPNFSNVGCEILYVASDPTTRDIVVVEKDPDARKLMRAFLTRLRRRFTFVDNLTDTTFSRDAVLFVPTEMGAEVARRFPLATVVAIGTFASRPSPDVAVSLTQPIRITDIEKCLQT